MKTRMVEERIGENMGPVDWDHPMAQAIPEPFRETWKAAEKNPDEYEFCDGYFWYPIYEICMYDGWPYWAPTPSIHHGGPIGPEWHSFNSYGVRPNGIRKREDRPAKATEKT